MKIANVDMAKAWDGEEGDEWAEHADRYDATDTGQADRLLAAAKLGPGLDVLDIGCGTGKTTLDAARIVSPGAVLGVDLSSAMLRRARQTAASEGVDNVTFLQADVQVHDFEAESFDVAFSSYGAMFFAEPIAAFANIGRALRPGGRLAVLAWRDLEQNEWLVAFRAALALGRDLPAPQPSMPGPFGLCDEDHVTGVLNGAGYRDIAFEKVDDPMRLGTDADDAYDFLRGMGLTRWLTSDLDDASKQQAFGNLRDLVTRHATPDGVLLGSASWLITATARR